MQGKKGRLWHLGGMAPLPTLNPPISSIMTVAICYSDFAFFFQIAILFFNTRLRC